MSSNTERIEKLTLEGRLAIENSREIYKQIATLFKNSMELHIYLLEITEIELSFLQIIFSLFVTSRKLGKKVLVFIDKPEEIWDTIVDAGLETQFRINKDPGKTFFKIEGIFYG